MATFILADTIFNRIVIGIPTMVQIQRGAGAGSTRSQLSTS